MAFDPFSAKPVDEGGFDISTAKPVFQETPGGAVTGIKRQPKLLSPEGEAMTDIAGAGGVGTALGIVAPEILTGIAGGLRQIPQGARIAPIVESAAIAAKGAGRPATALAGGISGLASEAAGQAAETAGAGPATAEGFRFIAGGVTPEGLTVAKKIVDLYKQTPSLGLFAKGKKELIKSISAKLEGRPQDISQEEADYLNTLVSDLRGSSPSDTSRRGVYDILQRGARTRLAVGDAEARTIISNADKAIQNELDKATKGPVAYAGQAANRISRRGEEALATAQLQRTNIGEDVSLSDIGNSLRQTIVGRNQAAIEARHAGYEAAQKQRDAVVSKQEEAGNYIDSLPQYKMLVANLKSEMQPGKHSPDVSSTFANILKQISTKAKPIEQPFGGMGGDVFATAESKSAPVSFQQLDDVRRQLGEVFRGNPPEGYAAIDAATARKYYKIISDIQKKYAGAPQEKLLSQYSEASQGLDVFGSKAGRRATAVDRYDDTKFQTDAAALPGQFFGSKQGIQDLVELTGNRTEVVNAAKNMAATELNGLTESQVRAWMTKRRDMLESLPEVRDAVLKYANHLQFGEDTARRAQNAVGRLTAYQGEQQRMAQQRGTAIQREAQSRAGQITSQREQEAISLLGAKGEAYPIQNINALIDSGSTKEWSLAAPHILADPNGKELLADALKQRLSERALKSTKGLSTFFDDNARPGLTATRLMKTEEIDRISSQLRAIENMKLPEQEKLGMARRVILQGFGGMAASLAARGITYGANMIPAPSPELVRMQNERERKGILSPQETQPMKGILSP